MKGVKNEGRGWGIHMCINKYIYIFFCCIYLYFWLYLYNCICFHVLFRRASVPRLHQRRSLGRSFCQVKQERDPPGGYINTVTVIVAHTLCISKISLKAQIFTNSVQVQYVQCHMACFLQQCEPKCSTESSENLKNSKVRQSEFSVVRDLASFRSFILGLEVWWSQWKVSHFDTKPETCLKSCHGPGVVAFLATTSSSNCFLQLSFSLRIVVKSSSFWFQFYIWVVKHKCLYTCNLPNYGPIICHPKNLLILPRRPVTAPWPRERVTWVSVMGLRCFGSHRNVPFF